MEEIVAPCRGICRFPWPNTEIHDNLFTEVAVTISLEGGVAKSLLEPRYGISVLLPGHETKPILAVTSTQKDMP